MRVTFPCDELILEGEVTLTGSSSRGAVICHPHPRYGGDMDNPVVCAVTAALQEAGFATLRFNFRGVGGSSGSHGGGVGEIDDACAAVRYLIARSGVARITLAGYSFGAVVALQAGASMPEVDRLIAIAPPLEFSDLGAMAACEKDKLFIAGDRDAYCGATDLARELGGVADPKTDCILTGADHFFVGREPDIAAAVRAFVAV